MLRWMVNLMITSMLFFPEKTFYEKPSDYGLKAEDVFLTTEDHVRIHGWYLAPENKAKGALLYFHGNAGNISGRIYKAKGWVDLGFAVFLVDYRGYGKSEGEIEHEEDLILDGKAAYEWLLREKNFPASKIILYGESLGSYPAVQLATRHKTASLILEAPFTSFVDLAKIHYSQIPGTDFLLKDFRFSNVDKIHEIQSPLFILHGTRDETCPYAMSGDLIDKAPEPKGFFTIPGGAHNDLPIKAGDDYWQKPYEFVEKYLKN